VVWPVKRRSSSANLPSCPGGGSRCSLGALSIHHFQPRGAASERLRQRAPCAGRFGGGLFGQAAGSHPDQAAARQIKTQRLDVFEISDPPATSPEVFIDQQLQLVKHQAVEEPLNTAPRETDSARRIWSFQATILTSRLREAPRASKLSHVQAAIQGRISVIQLAGAYLSCGTQSRRSTFATGLSSAILCTRSKQAMRPAARIDNARPEEGSPLASTFRFDRLKADSDQGQNQTCATVVPNLSHGAIAGCIRYQQDQKSHIERADLDQRSGSQDFHILQRRKLPGRTRLHNGTRRW